MKRNRFFSVAFCLILGLAMGLSLAKPVSADSFNQNNIIDDTVFDNTGVMNVTQIDGFLNSFPNSCISSNSGFGAVDPTGYNPTSGYTYGSYVTAGQVIYDAAQAYGLNPQVLLATLQKEQGIVVGATNFCSNGDQNKYTAAVGYGCPDSGATYSYSNLNLYERNGVTVSSTGSTCVNSPLKAGFSQQVIRAAWLLKFGEQRSQGNTGWAVIKGSWNNSDDPQTCYGGPMTQGTYQRCPSGGLTYYDGYTTIDGTAVHMDTGATAALYWYTPHFHGNQSFFSLFYAWFGPTHAYFGNIPSSSSTYARSACDIPGFDSSMIGRLYNPDTQDFLYTTSRIEACSAVSYGYIWDDVVMQNATGQDAIPVYRIANYNRHIFTTSASVRDSAIASQGYHDEGVPFYVYSTAGTGRTAVYGLQSGPTFFFTSAGKEAESYVNTYGYSSYGVIFYTPALDTGDFPVNRLVRNNQRIYTPNLVEVANAMQYGFQKEGTVSVDDTMPNVGNMPVYRLKTPAGIYVYTTSRLDRDIDVIYYNCVAEGMPFYSLAYSNTPVYAATNPHNGFWIYASNPQEYNDATSYYSYLGDGTGWYGY